MPVVIDAAQVRHIAKLSRLKLTAAEEQLFAGQLAAILDYVRQLDGVDTQGVAPLAHPLPLTNVVREDEPGTPLDGGASHPSVSQGAVSNPSAIKLRRDPAPDQGPARVPAPAAVAPPAVFPGLRDHP